MAKQLQLRRGTTEQHASFTGAPGEVTVDTDKKALVVHDGATAGGVPVARAGGNAAQRFKVANAVENDEAMALGQFRGVTLLANGTNINSLIQSGWYEGFELANRPSGTSWIRVMVIAHFNITHAQQVAYDFFNNRSWERGLINGIWSPWVTRNQAEVRAISQVNPNTTHNNIGWTELFRLTHYFPRTDHPVTMMFKGSFEGGYQVSNQLRMLVNGVQVDHVARHVSSGDGTTLHWTPVMMHMMHLQGDATSIISVEHIGNMQSVGRPLKIMTF